MIYLVALIFPPLALLLYGKIFQAIFNLLIYALAWVLAAVTGGLAGLLISTIYELGPDMYTFGLRAFPAVILGGLDSAIGSAVSGVIVGILENLGEGFIGKGIKEVAGFIVILIVLMVRPYGLFGTREVERV